MSDEMRTHKQQNIHSVNKIAGAQSMWSTEPLNLKPSVSVEFGHNQYRPNYLYHLESKIVLTD